LDFDDSFKKVLHAHHEGSEVHVDLAMPGLDIIFAKFELNTGFRYVIVLSGVVVMNLTDLLFFIPHVVTAMKSLI